MVLLILVENKKRKKSKSSKKVFDKLTTLMTNLAHQIVKDERLQNL